MKLVGDLTLTNGSDSHAPAEALRAAGLSGALLRDMATASTPRKNAVRRMAPRFPGSSWQLVSRKKCANENWKRWMGLTIPSNRRMKGYLGKVVLYSMLGLIPLITSSSRD